MDLLGIMRKVVGLDFVFLLILAGLFLAVVGYQINSPIKEKLRLVGFCLAGFGVGCVVSMIILGTDLRLQYFDLSGQNVDFQASAKGKERAPGKKAPGGETLAERGLKGTKPEIRKGNETKDNFYEIGRWEGNGPKKTELFQIPSEEWSIYWDAEPSTPEKPQVFTIKVYASDNRLIYYLSNIRNKRDNILFHSSGKYYLVIEANESYKVIVTAKRRNTIKPVT